MKKDIVLDDAAQELFDALGGIDASARIIIRPRPEGDLSWALGQEETRMDEWRILLVEFFFRLAGHLRGLRLTGLTEQRVSEREDLFTHLSRLIDMPDRGSKILLRFRGMFAAGGKVGQESDYVVTYGPVTLDIPIVKALVNRQGVSASHLTGRVITAFELLSSMQINTLHISLRKWDNRSKKQMDLCFQALGQYFVGIAGATAASNFGQMKTGCSPTVVMDPHQRADPGLTLLAVVNGLPVETVQGLANKIAHMVRTAKKESPLNNYPNTYEAVFAFKNLREKLQRPLIEINNVRWLIAGREEEVITREKAAVGRLVMEKFYNSPRKAAQLIDSIYGTDFPDIAADALDARLGRVTDFLDQMDADEEDPTVEDEVLEQVNERLDQVPEEVFDGLTIGDATDEGRAGKVAGTGGKKLHGKLLGMVSFFKRRFSARKKIRRMMNEPVQFDEKDYETIAKDFGIMLRDAQSLVDLLKGCFDEDGHFLRPAFEKNIPAFAQYENKVFEFLWYYLKEIRGREDRVAFLNSIQTLIARMKQRKEAMRIILNDFIKVKEAASFSDRNALMLANLLIRKYNKELRMDIEISPEEVLRVRDGLDTDIIHDIHLFLEEKREPLFHKMRAVHRKTKEMLDGKDHGSPIPIRYLLSLERECYIFLALAGGATAHRIIYGVVKEYGDPASEIYHLAKSGRAVKGLIQLLRVALRGLRRFAESEDWTLIQEVSASEPEFYKLTKDEGVRYAIAGLMKWIDSVPASEPVPHAVTP